VGPSIQRAGVMGGAGLVAALAGGRRRVVRARARGGGDARAQPRVSGEPGWQLSFAAVVGLLALVPALAGGAAARGAARAGSRTRAAVTSAATVATAPLMAFHFEQVSLASLPANLAAAAAVAPVMWLGMVAIAVAQVSPALCGPLNALKRAAALLCRVGRACRRAAARRRRCRSGSGGPATLALSYAALAAGIALAGRAWRWIAAEAGGGGLLAQHEPLRRSGMRRRRVVAAATAAAGRRARRRPRPRHAPRPQPGDFVISFLNIGQGDATLLQHGGASILFDTGPPGGPILTRLRQAGVRRLDALVLTHAQLDHEGMAVPITRKYHPRLGPRRRRRLEHADPARPARERRARAPGPAARAGRHPPPAALAAAASARLAPEGDPNNRAVVAIASVGSFDVLLTADAESDITGPLQLPPVEVLKVAHHGSEDPASGAARPHPARLRGHRGRPRQHLRPPDAAHPGRSSEPPCPHVYRTDRDGTVRLHVTAAGVTVEHAP
jgi:competence protein ComEC